MLNNFIREIDKIKIEAQQNYKKEKIEINPSSSYSQYLIDFRDIDIDQKWLNEYFIKFISTWEKFEGDEDRVAERLRQGFEQKDLDLEQLVKKVVSSDSNYLMELAEKLQLEKETLSFLGLELGKPVFELYAEKFKDKLDLDNWEKEYCPLCGSLPAFAYLREEDGKRILWCRFCETKWSFLRLKCPFCSNEDQDSLRYFFTEEGSPYRVDVCEKCNKYIKTIDQRKMQNPDELSLSLENMQTYYLDLLAEKDGYSNPLV